MAAAQLGPGRLDEGLDAGRGRLTCSLFGQVNTGARARPHACFSVAGLEVLHLNRALP